VAPGDWPQTAAPPSPGFRFAGVHEYAQAYRKGITSPLEVAERVLRAIDAGNHATPPMRAVIAVRSDDVLRQAEAATRRLRQGSPLSFLDGVPFGIKDEVDMVPYATTAGTAFLGAHPSTTDATVVGRLRAAGALLIGKTNMHEIGIGVTGLNPAHGTPRNPYATGHHTGGSSSGSASAVASGLCPVALAADGGGSIRIPAALCGVVGLKPTYGRVSENGAVPLCWSVAHIGPIAANVTDAALGYAALAGPDPRDPNSLHQPAPSLLDWNKPDLQGVRLGVFTPWFQHADSEVVSVCRRMVDGLRDRGAQVREVSLPGLEAARVAHAITICSEMAQAMSAHASRHGRDHAHEVRVTLALARALTARDYIKAQRVRTALIQSFRRVFQEVDAVISPTTAIPAPHISEASLDIGVSDLALAAELMRFTTPANLAGLPAISFPAGYTAGGLPIGIQAIGRPWEESLLLRIALAGEACMERRAPATLYSILGSH
jgi:Asp-tRNA(Asn)/Glu-tRNA(Gln) amidotransferase A subunit family amidase